MLGKGFIYGCLAYNFNLPVICWEAKDDSMIRFGGIEPSSAQIEISTVYGDREYAGGGEALDLEPMAIKIGVLCR